ncbi:MAG: energy transducer TonB [Comamonas sp.]|uniref:energy transducer TonB n=1 Tax=Comamonas sp. TaxID=34028 RepID=UPI002828D33F|nr:energy transducer TonB [Comamonas sp.]MDR0214616.1 energy transducer TonB [Comamonas sp.]
MLPASLLRTGLRSPASSAVLLLAALWLGGCRQIPLAPEPSSERDGTSVQSTDAEPTRSRIQSTNAAPVTPPEPDETPPTSGPRGPQMPKPLGGSQARWLASSERPHWLQDCFAPHQLDAPLQIQRTVLPDYPQAMAVNEVQGRFIIVFEVSAAGKVGNHLAQPGAHPALVKPSIAALQKWKFSHPTAKGQPVSACLAQVFRYQLED